MLCMCMLLWCVRGPRIYSTAYTLQDTGTVFDKARTRLDLEAGWVVRECRLSVPPPRNFTRAARTATGRKVDD